MKDIEMNDIELNESAAAEETNGMAADEAAKTEETSAQGNNEASEEADGEASETGAKEKNTEKKGFFSKKKDKKDEQIEELTDRLKRTMAEFDNFRKRTEKEKAAMYEIGAKDIVERILPVVDNFERGLAAIPEAEVKSAFAEGMVMHHQMAVDMAETIIKYSDNDSVTDYANSVIELQGQEISQMQDFLDGKNGSGNTHWH